MSTNVPSITHFSNCSYRSTQEEDHLHSFSRCWCWQCTHRLNKWRTFFNWTQSQWNGGLIWRRLVKFKDAVWNRLVLWPAWPEGGSNAHKSNTERGTTAAPSPMINKPGWYSLSVLPWDWIKKKKHFMLIIYRKKHQSTNHQIIYEIKQKSNYCYNIYSNLLYYINFTLSKVL